MAHDPVQGQQLPISVSMVYGSVTASPFYLDTGNHWDHILLQAHDKLSNSGSCNQGLEVLNTMLKITCRFGLHLQYYVKYAYTRNVAGIQRGKWRAEVAG